MKLFLFITWMIQHLIVTAGENTTESDFLVNLNSLNIKEELGHVPEPESDNEESIHGIRNRYFRVQRALEAILKRPIHGSRPLAINPGALIKDTTFRQVENVITTPPKLLNKTEPTEPTKKIRAHTTVRPYSMLTMLSRRVATILKKISTKAYSENITSSTVNNFGATITTKKPNTTTPYVSNTTTKVTTEKISSASTQRKDSTVKILKSTTHKESIAPTATTHTDETTTTTTTTTTMKPISSEYHTATTNRLSSTEQIPTALIQPEDIIINLLKSTNHKESTAPTATTNTEEITTTTTTTTTMKPNSSEYHRATTNHLSSTEQIPKALIQPEDIVINLLVKIDIPSNLTSHNTMLNQTITIFGLL